ncbi:MAG: hypothetical protein K6F94_03985 [Bacteroidaceae bacterium]|nr:hypothetical protein [Bacteroidaceae bacterium]
MTNVKYLFMLLLLAVYASHAEAQTDVTSMYLSDPSFENVTKGTQVTKQSDGLRGWNISSMQGWTTTIPETQLLISADCFTDNNFGKTDIADGQYALYQRVGWNLASSTVSQTTSSVPAGKYQLTFCTKAFYANNATSSGTITLSAGAQTVGIQSFSFISGSAGCMTDSEWTTHKVSFTLDQESSISIVLDLSWQKGGSCIVIDNFRLISLPDDYNEEEAGQTVIGGRETDITSPTEGVITHTFVDEATMMNDLLQMLATSMTYAKNIWYDCAAPNSINESCGFFKANSAGNSNEDGVRTNADFSMICAFLYKYARTKVTLPTGVSWDDIKSMALKSLIFGYSTHKANKLKVTSNNAYWGSTSTSDYVWESSLWAMSLAYSSFFLADELSDTQKDYIYKMLKAECNYELYRSIPAGYNGDTKAEENGWEADILAATLGLYPDDALADKWFQRLREFAVNSYSQTDDAANSSVIDPDYDQKTVADLYLGQPNLYEDYTLQNHNYFHTSYQNVVIQELGEAALALQLFQGDKIKWKTNALMHGNQAVMDNVLAWLALADGELAMPNGNDWSMFLFDQITSYSTLACFLRDPDALMLENMAYKYIKARQQTTSDGSWLLNSDIGPRRMGVEGHRVMMTYLMHLAASTSDMQPTSWDNFLAEHMEARRLLTQNIVRAASPYRFVTFSWSTGLKSYTGYFADTTPDRNKIVCPYKANNTGNLLGWYNVSGKSTNATPVTSGIYSLKDNSFTMNGTLNTNDATLQNRFVLAATAGNAVILMNRVTALADATVSGRRGGLLAISTDPFMRTQRTLYHAAGRVQTDGSQMSELPSTWVNIDNSVGVVTAGGTGTIGFGDRALSNSIQMSKLYPLYSNTTQNVQKGQTVDRSAVIYYSRIDSAATAAMQQNTISLADRLPDTWNGLIAPDTDGTRYLLLANFQGGSTDKVNLSDISFAEGAPVFSSETTIIDGRSSASFSIDEEHSSLQHLCIYIQGADVYAKAISPTDEALISLRAIGSQKQTATITYIKNGKKYTTTQNVEPEGTYLVTFDDEQLQVNTEIETEEEQWVDVTSQLITNPNFEEDNTWGTVGNITLGNVTYNPCYTQSITPLNDKFPQVLPVAGWTAENGLAQASNYALLYSMPYSFSQYCVSPSGVGNSATIRAIPAAFADNCGSRCLSVLNSWTTGKNAISQELKLPFSGRYRLTFDMLYTCANESRRTAPNVITTTGNNTNTSLCGIVVQGEELYAPYPSTSDSWEEMVLDFDYSPSAQGGEDTTEPVTLRLGLQTTASIGAAHNTRLYIDNLQLSYLQTDANGIGSTPAATEEPLNSLMPSADQKTYDISGRPVSSSANGILIKSGKKTIKRP